MNSNKDHMISKRLCMDASPILENYLRADAAGLFLKLKKISIFKENLGFVGKIMKIQTVLF